MDPKYTGEVLKHLEKQQELLKETAHSMSHELEKLQVEEEMLMRKFYEIMSSKGFTKKNNNLQIQPLAPKLQNETSVNGETSQAADSVEKATD